jgi:protein arginine kinase activator
MICQRCQKGMASVHVTEIQDGNGPAATPQVNEHHLCESCAQTLDLPHAPAVPTKAIHDIWKFLQANMQVRTKRVARQCPDCKMTLDELRRRGKVGCAKDYEVFADYLGELIERMHGASEHCGRLPGVGEHEMERRARIGDLKNRLERAIREEDYECAAGLRDELRTLEHEPGVGS